MRILFGAVYKLPISFTLLCLLVQVPAHAMKISAQFVVDQILAQGREINDVKYEAEKLAYPVALAEAAFDWQLTSSADYELSKEESLTSTSVNQNKITQWTVGVQKKLPTGTQFTTSYQNYAQDTTFNPNATLVYPSLETKDTFDFEIRQNIGSNFFGLLDRYKVYSAQKDYSAAQMNKLEQTEGLILQGLQAFWDTYVAKENLRESMNARDRYAELVRVLNRKGRLGLAQAAEPLKAQAEYEIQVQTVKQASDNYLAQLDNLFRLMHVEQSKDDVEFQAQELLPALPQDILTKVEELRTIKIAEINLEKAHLEREAAMFSGYPSVDLVGKYIISGIESQNSRAFSDMMGGTHPHYFVGVELTMPFGSSLVSGTKANKEILYNQAINDLAKTKETELNNLQEAKRKVLANYEIAKSAIEAVNLREKVVKEQDRSFKQGRIDTTTLILDYNALFSAYTDRTRAIGNYHIALNQLAAATDQLVR